MLILKRDNGEVTLSGCEDCIKLEKKASLCVIDSRLLVYAFCNK